jgi:hypothetical protein
MAYSNSSGTPENTRNNQGTGFVNFNDILNNNAQSGTAMGNAVAGGLQSQGQAVNDSLKNKQNEFNTGIQDVQSKWNNVSGLADQLASSNTDTQAKTTDENGNPINYNSAGQNFANFSYNGPKELSNAQGLQAQATSAANTGALAGTTQGQQQLLRQYVGGANYTPGQTQFDQALLNKYGNSQINQAARGLNGLGSQVQSAAQNAQQQATTTQNLINNQKQADLQTITASLGNENAGTGVLGTAQNAGNDFTKNARSLNTILSALQGGQTGITNLKAQIAAGTVDPSVLKDISKYGNFDVSSLNGATDSNGNIINSKDGIYYKNGSNFNLDQLSPFLKQYTLNAAMPSGGLLFSGNQQQAANNLANFLHPEQQATYKSLNTNVFDPFANGNAATLKDALGNLSKEQNTDITARSDIEKANSELPGLIKNPTALAPGEFQSKYHSAIDPIEKYLVDSSQDNNGPSYGLAIPNFNAQNNPQYKEYLNNDYNNQFNDTLNSFAHYTPTADQITPTAYNNMVFGVNSNLTNSGNPYFTGNLYAGDTSKGWAPSAGNLIARNEYSKGANPFVDTSKITGQNTSFQNLLGYLTGQQEYPT